MKFIANTFFIAMIWRRYKRLLIAVALLIGSYFLVSIVHDDYLDYAKNSGNDALLGLSYVIKWLVLLVATVLFYFIITTRDKSRALKKSQQGNLKDGALPQTDDRPDPFDAIRHKKSLRGRADQYLDDI